MEELTLTAVQEAAISRWLVNAFVKSYNGNAVAFNFPYNVCRLQAYAKSQTFVVCYIQQAIYI